MGLCKYSQRLREEAETEHEQRRGFADPNWSANWVGSGKAEETGELTLGQHLNKNK